MTGGAISMDLEVARKIAGAAGPFFPLIRLAQLLVLDVASWRFVPAWFNSFRSTFSPVKAGVPWLPFRATDWLESHVHGDMKVFEFGSGGSTIFLSQHARSLHTVEHDRVWHETISAALKQRGITNCCYMLREPQPINGSFRTSDGLGEGTVVLDEREWEYPRMNFVHYVDAIEQHPDRSFDLILVDGRARGACLQQAIRKIRADGWVMLDNSNSPEFINATAAMRSYERTDFHAIAPGWPPARWTTSVWQVG